MVVPSLCGIFIAGQTVWGAAPNVEVLGQILGYPSDQIIVTDVTAREREIVVNPPRSWEPAKAGVPPENIVESYRVTAKDPRTFHPIVITIGKEGTYFSPRSQELIEEFDSHKEAPLSKGGGLGRFTISGVGEAGLFLSEIRVPTIAMAMVSEIRVPALKREIRIAWMAALDVQGQSELVAIPGGETYYALFGPVADDFKGDRYNPIDLFTRLGRAVFDSVLANQSSPRGAATPNSNSVDNAPSVRDANHGHGLPATRVTPDRDGKAVQVKERGRGQEGNDSISRIPIWGWWAIGLVVAVGALLAIRRFRP